MRIVRDFILLLAMFIAMIVIGDYLFQRYIPNDFKAHLSQFGNLGYWPGFIFALAISYFFFRRSLYRLALYLTGVGIVVILLMANGLMPGELQGNLENQYPLMQKIQAYVPKL